MNARHIIAFLLALAILLTSAVHPASARMSFARAAAEEDEPQLTPEEEREARDVALRFDDRLKTTNDVGPLIDELFVRDFPERLRHSWSDCLPLAFLDKNLVMMMSRDELRRYYVIAINFYALFHRLTEVTASLRKQAGEDNDDWGPEDALTPEMINVLLGDPTLALLVEEARGREKDEPTKEGNGSQPAASGDSSKAAGAATQTDAVNDDNATDDEFKIIKSYAQLASFTSTLEKTNDLMRKRLATLPLPLRAPADDTAAAQTQEDSSKPSLLILDEEHYGYPKGTRLVHIDAMPFCLTLIKTDGRLKILSATLYVD